MNPVAPERARWPKAGARHHSHEFNIEVGNYHGEGETIKAARQCTKAARRKVVLFGALEDARRWVGLIKPPQTRKEREEIEMRPVSRLLKPSHRMALWLGLYGLALSACGQLAHDTIVLSTFYPAENRLNIQSQLILREAFLRMGYDVRFEVLPVKRSELVATTGECDGEVPRSWQYGTSKPSLIRVMPPIFLETLVAYAAKPLTIKDGWDALKGTDLRINFRMGDTKVQKELQDRVPVNQLESVVSSVNGLNKLLAGRADVYINLESDADFILNQPSFKGSTIHKVSRLENVDGYLYLNVKRKELAEPIGRILARMHNDGTSAKLMKLGSAQAKQ